MVFNYAIKANAFDYLCAPRSRVFIIDKRYFFNNLFYISHRSSLRFGMFSQISAFHAL